MKTVKINYVGLAEGEKKIHSLIYDQLKFYGYDVQVTEDADYLFYDYSGGDPYLLCGKPQVRIMYSGENYIPDFNLVDYVISPYPISFGDRNFCLPVCVYPSERWHSLPDKDRNYTREFLESKEYFANYISSHESEYQLRGKFFHELSEYKRVEAAGSHLNNMPNGETVDWLDGSKIDFQRKCKFTICFESTLHEGFVTEKLTDAFFADTIPIYYGPAMASEIFNKDAFINVADYPSFEAAIEKIKELDQNDEKYLEMLRQPILVDPTYPSRLEKDLGAYICHIFDQPLDKAYRRSRVYSPQNCDNYLSRAVDSEDMTFAYLIKRLLLKLKEKTFSLFRRS